MHPAIRARAAGRVAARLLERGLHPGDRVAAYGKNSDAYLLLYLGCVQAGLVHVPVNFNARRDELVYLPTQSAPRAAFVDPSLGDAVDQVSGRLGELHRATLRDGPVADDDVLTWALDREGSVHEENGVGDDDLVQLLHTSGTTSRAKGAMLTHRALVHEYVSAIVAFELSERDVPLHALPLHHSAQMHCFLMPAPDSVGRAVLFVETRVVDPDFNDVAAGEVEDATYEHEAVAEVAVVGLPKNASGKLLKRELRDQLSVPAAAAPS